MFSGHHTEINERNVVNFSVRNQPVSTHKVVVCSILQQAERKERGDPISREELVNAKRINDLPNEFS